MKIFLSAIDKYTLDELQRQDIKMKWNLLSYYQIKKGDSALFREVLLRSESMLIDSGAHSFQKGAKVNWLEYTKQYAEWISQVDNPKILGYFEMDVDNVIGYERVKELRTIIERVTDKVIPVWHKNRGIKDFIDMCKEFSGRIVAISGFNNEDIKDSQFGLFCKEAHKHGCKIHCLGMTRTKVLDRVPFDYTDSASWKLRTTWGKVKINGERKNLRRRMPVQGGWNKVWAYAYRQGIEMQEYYYQKWKHINKD